MASELDKPDSLDPDDLFSFDDDPEFQATCAEGRAELRRVVIDRLLVERTKQMTDSAATFPPRGGRAPRRRRGRPTAVAGVLGGAAIVVAGGVAALSGVAVAMAGGKPVLTGGVVVGVLAVVLLVVVVAVRLWARRNTELVEAMLEVLLHHQDAQDLSGQRRDSGSGQLDGRLDDHRHEDHQSIGGHRDAGQPGAIGHCWQ